MLNRNHSKPRRSAVRSLGRSVVARSCSHVWRGEVAPSVINTNQSESAHLTHCFTLKALLSIRFTLFNSLSKGVSLFRMNIN